MIRPFVLSLLLCTPLAGNAAATPEQIASLDGPVYTAVGAERAGNSAGTIPAWQDGLASWPEGDIARDGLGDPFAGEEELFRITASNVEEHADSLSEGQVALLKRYPETYYLPVYPSHRISSYPQAVLDRVKASALEADMVPGGNGLVNLNGSTVPFPFPESGLEAVWNHITRYRGGSVQRTYSQIPVQANGAFSPVIFRDKLVFASALPPGAVSDNRLFLYLQQIMAPARLEGDILLVHENINQILQPRNAWLYNAGQRRVRRAPNVSYDGPGRASDALRTSDDLDAYNGAPDRYNWKLLGKQEKYIGINAYRLYSKDLEYSDIILPGHINPAYTRYELHRVWVVEATLKPGERHIYGRRVFYLDEDTWTIALKDQYDGRGELWRVAQGHGIYHYDARVPWGSEAQNDLVSGRYLLTGLDNEVPRHGYIWGLEAKPSDFTPQALRRAGRR
ncbi:MAG: DUF1329 domain-containing protein [Halieaceae bacterium]